MFSAENIFFDKLLASKNIKKGATKKKQTHKLEY